MNDLQIDYFMAVATNLSFTKTSEELYVSQPAISKQIALMEKELGVKLFYRNNKKTRLTEAGELFYQFFSDYKLEFRNVQRKALLAQNEETSDIAVGFIEGWDLSEIIPDLVRRFSDRYPKTRLSIHCLGAKELSTLLLTGGIDLALTMQNSLEDFGELSLRPVHELRKLIIYSAKSREASLPELTLKDFKGRVFYAPWGVAEKMITRVIHAYCQPYGFAPDIEFVHNNESMITCVRNDLGVAFSDEWTWAIHSDDLCYLPLDITDTITVAHVANTNSEHTLFAAELLSDIVSGL